MDADAIVIGAGQNGLVAANALADAGWSVLVLEGQAEPGRRRAQHGADAARLRARRLRRLLPAHGGLAGLPHLALEQEGLEWRHGPLVLAHPTPDGRAASSRATSTRPSPTSRPTTAATARLARAARALGARRPHALEAFLGPMPPIGPGLRLAARLGPRGVVDFGRFAALPVRRLVEERFAGAGASNLYAGNALHADLAPEALPSGMFGWVLVQLGHDVGFPFPRGGAQQVTQALLPAPRGARRPPAGRTPSSACSCAAGARSRCARGGDELAARRAILADVDAPRLLLELVGAEHLPARVLDGLRRSSTTTRRSRSTGRSTARSRGRRPTPAAPP